MEIVTRVRSSENSRSSPNAKLHPLERITYLALSVNPLSLKISSSLRTKFLETVLHLERFLYCALAVVTSTEAVTPN
jgi:hypothetical protein